MPAATTDPHVEFPRFVHVPWIDGEPHSARANQTRQIAAALASKSHALVEGGGTTKDQLPDGWGSLPCRTLKSLHGVPHSSVVEIHFWPSFDTLAAMPRGPS